MVSAKKPKTPDNSLDSTWPLYLQLGTVITFIAIFGGYFLFAEDSAKEKISFISDSLLKIESSHFVESGSRKPKVAVGYGACYDIFADVIPFLKYEEFEGEPQHFDDISTVSELMKSFAYYFRHGAAAERFMSNSSLFDELVAYAETGKNTRWAIGGNAPVMASRFLAEGCDVVLAAKVTDRLRKNLPHGLKVASGGLIDRDDIHLILEYKANAKWGPYTAPRANRYILHNDENNPMVSSLEPLEDVLPDFDANLLVVSGLQMMDSYPFNEGVREKRLAKITNQMISQRPSTLLHFEMASYVEAKLMVDLTDQVIPYADSLGMNEQELVNLYHTLKYGNISIVTDSNPRVATALDQLRNIFKLIRNRNKDLENSRKITRIHVHTLAYQAIMTVKGSAWKQTKAATAKASLTAHRHVCGTKSILPAQVRLVMDDSFSTSAKNTKAQRKNLDPLNPVSCWDESWNVDGKVDVLICVAPVLVCTNAQQTAGAGDNISAAGLVLQI